MNMARHYAITIYNHPFIPSGDKNIFGRLLLPVRGAGKVKVGQHVNIRLANYPYLEFGQLEGVITNISSVPSGGFYYVQGELPQWNDNKLRYENPFFAKPARLRGNYHQRYSPVL